VLIAVGDDVTSSAWHKTDCPLILQQECDNIPLRNPISFYSSKVVYKSPNEPGPSNLDPMIHGFHAGVTLPATTLSPFKTALPILPAPNKSIFTKFFGSKFQSSAMHTGHGDICTNIQHNDKKLSVKHFGSGNIVTNFYENYKPTTVRLNCRDKRKMSSYLHSCSPSADQASWLQSQRRLGRQKRRRRLKRLRKKL